MGIETAILVAAVSAAATVGKASSQMAAEEAQENALDMQAKQQRLNYQQKTLDNYNQTLKLLDVQKAAMSTRGVAYSSPSFNAIQRSSLNISSKRQKNYDTEQSLAQANIEASRENAKKSLYAQLFGDALDLANLGMGMYNSMPKSGSKIPNYIDPNGKPAYDPYKD